MSDHVSPAEPTKSEQAVEEQMDGAASATASPKDRLTRTQEFLEALTEIASRIFILCAMLLVVGSVVFGVFGPSDCAARTRSVDLVRFLDGRWIGALVLFTPFIYGPIRELLDRLETYGDKKLTPSKRVR